MADVTVNFTGTAGTLIDVHDPNFTQTFIVGTKPVLDGSGNLEQDATFDVFYCFYENATGEHQRATINMSAVDQNTGLDFKTSPVVRASASNVGYFLRYTNDGVNCSSFSLRRWNGVTGGSTFVTQLTTIPNAPASTFFDWILEAEDIDANTVRITATVNGNSESYDDTSASRIHTGQPGLVIGSNNAASLDKINTFITQDLAVGVDIIADITIGISVNSTFNPDPENPIPVEYYVRPAGAHANTPDGLSFETAWLGWTNVLWGASPGNVGPNDILYVCGAHVFNGANALPGASSATDGRETIIRGDYPEQAGSFIFETAHNYRHAQSHFRIVNLTIVQLAAVACIFKDTCDNVHFEGVITTGGTQSYNLANSDGANHTRLKILSGNSSGMTDTGVRFLASGTGFTTTLDDIEIDNMVFDGGDTALDGISLRFESDQNAASKMSNIRIGDNDITRFNRFVVRVSDEVTAGVPTSEDCLIEYNVIHDNGDDANGGAISLRGFKDSQAPNSGNNAVRYNTITDQIGNGGGIDIFYNTGTDIDHNFIRRMVADPAGIDANGILLDFGNKFTHVWANDIADCLGQPGSAANHNSGSAIMVLYANTEFRICGNKSRNTANGLFVGNTTSGVIEGDACNNAFLDVTKNGVIIATGNTAPESVQFKNNVSTEKAGESARPVYDDSGAATDIDSDYNTFYDFTLASLNHTEGSNSDTLNPLLDSETDEPVRGSPLVATGIVWWTGENPPSFTEEPFSETETDRGHVQTTYSKRHPTNATKGLYKS